MRIVVSDRASFKVAFRSYIGMQRSALESSPCRRIYENMSSPSWFAARGSRSLGALAFSSTLGPVAAKAADPANDRLKVRRVNMTGAPKVHLVLASKLWVTSRSYHKSFVWRKRIGRWEWFKYVEPSIVICGLSLCDSLLFSSLGLALSIGSVTVGNCERE